MERNVEVLRASRDLLNGVAALVKRCAALAGRLRTSEPAPERVARGGRKAHALSAAEE
jgi:hypothetical protein